MPIKKLLTIFIVTTGLLLPGITDAQQKDNIIVSANQPGADVQPTMWGIFFEDINLGADGGIYAELVKNRSFEFYMPMMGWTVKQDKFNEGIKNMPSHGLLTVLESNDLNMVNTFEKPRNVAPEELTIPITGKQINLSAAPYSFSVIKIKM